MKKEHVERFFFELSKVWRKPARILLVGGAGALILGGARPTLDVDFEAQLGSQKDSWEAFHEAVRKVAAETGIAAQYAESIERWAELSLLDYRKHTKGINRFGSVEVRVLEPEYWSIGKMGRYWDQDIQDMRVVFKRQKVDPERLASLWAKAIEKSPQSTQWITARKQAVHFFRTYGKEIWGKALNQEAIGARISSPCRLNRIPPRKRP